jgi:hypothetical protein
MSLTPTSRSNSCAICEDTGGKCRQGREDLSYWQCMIYVDAKKGEIIGGFKCIGHSKNGMWAQFKPNNSTEWTQQQRIEWQQENQRRQQQKASEHEQRRRRSLSAVDRDKAYRQLLSELTLHPDDKADLLQRGFSHSQIELSGFRSIERYHQLQGCYSDLLPGVNRNNQLIIRDEGYLCPIRNTEGLIVACQVRLRTLPNTESSRYRWLSGHGQVLHLYPKGCKLGGELPLAIHRSTEKPEGIALVEGTGSKPLLTSQRLNLLVIGAAGGQFLSSESILKTSLNKLSSELGGVKKLIIPPDAGDILNKQVMNRWRNLTELLKGWGYEVEFGWWGQVDKTHPDIDELEDFSIIEYISPHEFFKKGDESSSISPDQLLVIDETETARRLGISDNTPEWKRKAHANWKKNRQFTDAIKSCSKWCEWEKPPANSIFFGKGGLGRGKTTQLIGWTSEWKVEDLSFLCFGYRNSLLLQLCSSKKDKQGKQKGLGFYHLHEHSGMMMKSASGEGLALCVDSLWRFSPEDFDGKIIILDEVQSVIKHLLHSSTVRNRDKILGLFHEAIKRSRQVICLDGLMANWCVDYLHTICPEKQIIKAENTYQGKKPVVNYLLGTIVEGEENGKIKVNDRSPWFNYLMENSAVPVVCSDSQALIEALDNIFSERGLKVLRIDSKTVPEAYVKEFLEDCNAYIEEHRPDVLLYTPSAESGVDVSIPDYFTEHFAFFFGVLDVDSMLQMLGRIRDDITKYVWCKSFVSVDEKQHSKSPFADTIQKSLNQLLLSDISTSITNQETWNQEVIKHLTEIISNSNNVDTRLSTLIQSIQNFEKSNLRECLKEALLESGYTVKDRTLESSDHGKKAKEETEAVKRQNASDIFKAEKIPFELLKELSFDSKWEDRCKVMQARLRERLPGIDETDTWTEDFIYLTKYGDREFISKQEMFWLFNNPEIAKQQSQKHFHWMARRLNTFIGNYKSRWSKIHALHQIGLPEFLDSGNEWINDNPELIKLCKRAKAHKTALGCQGRLSHTQFLGKLLALIGLKLKSRKAGTSTRCYHIDRGVINDPIRAQVLACIERKFTETPAEKLTQIDWENAKNEAYGVSPSDAPQAHTEQDSQPQTPDPNFVYRNQGSGVSENLEEKASEIQEDLPTSHVAIDISLGSEREQLIQALPFAESVEDFVNIIEDSPLEMVQAAIVLSGDQPRRKQLDEWLEEFVKGSEQTDVEALIKSSEPPLIPTNVESLIKGNEQLPAPPEQEESTLKVGDRVSVPKWSHTAGFAPFLIEAIKGAFAQVEMFDKLIPLSDLEVMG